MVVKFNCVQFNPHVSPKRKFSLNTTYVQSTNNVRLNIREYKPLHFSNNKNVLLAHAIGFHGGVLEPIISSLCAHGYMCYALDFRAHGYSSCVENTHLDWPSFADDCLSVVSNLNIKNCHAFGHSFGAHALLMAEAKKPGTFKSIYAYEPIFLLFDDKVEGLNISPDSQNILKRAYIMNAKYRKTHFMSIDEVSNTYKNKSIFKNWDSEALDAYVTKGGFLNNKDGGVYLACKKDKEIAIYESGHNEIDSFDKLENISCPVIIAKGTSDETKSELPIYPAVTAPFIADKIPKGKIIEFPNNTHLGPMENPHDIAYSMINYFNNSISKL